MAACSLALFGCGGGPPSRGELAKLAQDIGDSADAYAQDDRERDVSCYVGKDDEHRTCFVYLPEQHGFAYWGGYHVLVCSDGDEFFARRVSGSNRLPSRIMTVELPQTKHVFDDAQRNGC